VKFRKRVFGTQHRKVRNSEKFRFEQRPSNPKDLTRIRKHTESSHWRCSYRESRPKEGGPGRRKIQHIQGRRAAEVEKIGPSSDSKGMAWRKSEEGVEGENHLARQASRKLGEEKRRLYGPSWCSEKRESGKFVDTRGVTTEKKKKRRRVTHRE